MKKVWVLNYCKTFDAHIVTLAVFANFPSVNQVNDAIKNDCAYKLTISDLDYDDLLRGNIVEFGEDGEVLFSLSEIEVTDNRERQVLRG